MQVRVLQRNCNSERVCACVCVRACVCGAQEAVTCRRGVHIGGGDRTTCTFAGKKETQQKVYRGGNDFWLLLGARRVEDLQRRAWAWLFGSPCLHIFDISRPPLSWKNYFCPTDPPIPNNPQEIDVFERLNVFFLATYIDRLVYSM